MQLVIHAGAHCTDGNRLVKCLIRNRDTLASVGSVAPKPSLYRKLLREASAAVPMGRASADARDILLDAILDDEVANRVILSNENFFGVPTMAVSGGHFYPHAVRKLARLQELFASDDVELFLAICNPATFLPAAFERSKNTDFNDFLEGSDPRVLFWSDLIGDIREALPNIPVTVWCNEDTPLIWSQVIRDIAGLAPSQRIKGGYEILASIMSKEGLLRFRAYLKDHPDMSEIQIRRVISAFLDKFAKEDAIEEVVDLPGFDADLIAQLTEQYEDDLFAIQRIPGVEVILP
ncbi:hypothetical protein A9Q95_03715 [Rhodobacterales bacterium 59_46_T64]|nr:hypothetical protein A9Q95_03715 [Rhodobacterales bacterium 59_46_T64]